MSDNPGVDEHGRIPPSPEVRIEPVRRFCHALNESLVDLTREMQRVRAAVTEFVRMWERMEMKHTADAMVADPREVDNRLTDWLRNDG